MILSPQFLILKVKRQFTQDFRLYQSKLKLLKMEPLARFIFRLYLPINFTIEFIHLLLFNRFIFLLHLHLSLSQFLMFIWFSHFNLLPTIYFTNCLLIKLFYLPQQLLQLYLIQLLPKEVTLLYFSLSYRLFDCHFTKYLINQQLRFFPIMIHQAFIIMSSTLSISSLLIGLFIQFIQQVVHFNC